MVIFHSYVNVYQRVPLSVVPFHRRQMGAIFVTKCSLTLQTDMLGTPEILWEHDRFDAQLGASWVIQVRAKGTLHDIKMCVETEIERLNSESWCHLNPRTVGSGKI